MEAFLYTSVLCDKCNRYISAGFHRIQKLFVILLSCCVLLMEYDLNYHYGEMK